jgi:hypothetical protein
MSSTSTSASGSSAARFRGTTCSSFLENTRPTHRSQRSKKQAISALSSPSIMDSDEYDSIHSATTSEAGDAPPNPHELDHDFLSLTQHDLFRAVAPIALFLCILAGLLIALWDPTSLPAIPSALPPGTTVRRLGRTPTEAAVLAVRAWWPAGVPGIGLFVLACFGVLSLVRIAIWLVASAATGFRDLKEASEERQVPVGRWEDGQVVSGDEMIAGLFFR